MAIDTLGYVKILQEAGVDRDVAEAHLSAMRTAIFPELATKTDLAGVEIRLDGKMTKLDVKISQVEQKLDAKISQVEQKLDGKIDRLEERIKGVVWQASLGILLGGLTIGGFLIRFLK